MLDSPTLHIPYHVCFSQYFLSPQSRGNYLSSWKEEDSPLILVWLIWALRPKGSNPYPLKTRDANSNHNIANICFALPKLWFETCLKQSCRAAAFSTAKDHLSCGMFCGYWPTIYIFIETGSWHMYMIYLFFLKDTRQAFSNMSWSCVSVDILLLYNSFGGCNGIGIIYYWN